MTLLKTTLTLPICALLLTTSLSTFADPPPKSEELNVEITIGHTMIDFTKKGGGAGKKSNSNNSIKKRNNTRQTSANNGDDEVGVGCIPAGCGKGKGLPILILAK